MAQATRSEGEVLAAVGRYVEVGPKMLKLLNDLALVRPVREGEESVDHLVRVILDMRDAVAELRSGEPSDKLPPGGRKEETNAGPASAEEKGDIAVPTRGWATNDERERCAVISRHVASAAARTFAVRRVRQLILGRPNGVVTPEQAFDLLESPALRYLGPGRGAQAFPHLGLGSQVELAPQEMHDDGNRQVVTRKFRVSVQPRKGMATNYPGTVTVADSDRAHESRTARFPLRSGGYGSAPAYHGTWLWVLMDWCARIAEQLHWDEIEAVWFVLTGEAPAIEPVRAALEVAYGDDGGVIHAATSLRVQPWVGDAAVLKALASVRGRRGLPRFLQPSAMRARVGLGRTRRRGKRWWIDYNLRGKRHREPSGSTDERVALELLHKRQDDIQTAIGHGRPRGTSERGEDSELVLARSRRWKWVENQGPRATAPAKPGAGKRPRGRARRR